MSYQRPPQPDCPGVGEKVAPRRTHGAQGRRTYVCPRCGRTVRVNYNGTLGRHVAQLKGRRNGT